jgi:hypothetical protein
MDEGPQYLGQISSLARRIRRSADGKYYRWHLARHMRTLVFEALAYEHGLTLEEVGRRLDSGVFGAPPEVLAYLRAGLAPIYSRSSSLLWRLRDRLASEVKSAEVDPDLLRVAEYLETMFEMGPSSWETHGQATARQSGTGQPSEVQYDR